MGGIFLPGYTDTHPDYDFDVGLGRKIARWESDRREFRAEDDDPEVGQQELGK